MRIIAGKYKGRPLKNFKAEHIRPTTDRVKETLFNKLMGWVEGARVLDLFSGTGNLALESISRGADWVDLVESHPKSVQIIRENISHLKITTGFKIHPVDVFKYIKNYTGTPYDIILADPPFTKELADSVMTAISESACFHANTMIVVEAARKERCEDHYGALIRLDRREFGDKNLNFYGQGDLSR
jgi:16S rRNA (guanine966-N2)-methyltransferase